MTTAAIPTRFEPSGARDLLIAWNTGEAFEVSCVELRFLCPCAGCVDERTGERTIERASVHPDVRPSGAQVVGRYALQIDWNDGHGTGMYHFDRLHEICLKAGRRVQSRS